MNKSLSLQHSILELIYTIGSNMARTFLDVYTYEKSVEPILSLVPRVEALASPNLSKRATPKAPRLCTYIESTLDNERQNHPKPMRAVYNTPHEAFCIALFLTNCVVNCQIPTRQNQSVQKRLLPYVCLSNLCPSGLPVWV